MVLLVLAGAASAQPPADHLNLREPSAIALDAAGNLYIADEGGSRVYKLPPGGNLILLAGTGTAGFSGDGGPAVEAQLDHPQGLVLRGEEVLVSDSGNLRVRKIDASGIITTVAGNGSTRSDGNGGPAVSAGLFNPRGLALDAAGNLYVAEYSGHTIRKIDSNGTITSVVGSGEPGVQRGDPMEGPATEARLLSASTVQLDASGNLVLVHNHQLLCRVDLQGRLTWLTGTIRQEVKEGMPARDALVTPVGIAFDAAGNLLFADEFGHKIRKIDHRGILTTVAGTGKQGHGGDGGPALQAMLDRPQGLALDKAGNLYVTSGRFIRKIDGTGVITTIAGSEGLVEKLEDLVCGGEYRCKLETTLPAGADATGRALTLVHVALEIPQEEGVWLDLTVSQESGPARAMRIWKGDRDSGLLEMLLAQDWTTLGPRILQAASRVCAGRNPCRVVELVPVFVGQAKELSLVTRLELFNLGDRGQPVRESSEEPVVEYRALTLRGDSLVENHLLGTSPPDGFRERFWMKTDKNQVMLASNTGGTARMLQECTVRLQPLALLGLRAAAWDSRGGDWSEVKWSFETHTATERFSTDQPGQPTESAPLWQVQVDPAFAEEGWKSGGLGSCAQPIGGAEKNGFLLHGEAGVAQDASFKALLLSDNQLLVELVDDQLVSGAAERNFDDHLEISLASEQPDDGKAAVRLSKPLQWDVRIADGQVFPALGTSLETLSVTRAGGTGASSSDPIRLKIQLPEAFDRITVIYSDSDDGKHQERRIGTSRLKLGQAETLGHVSWVDQRLASCQPVDGQLQFRDAGLTEKGLCTDDLFDPFKLW